MRSDAEATRIALERGKAIDARLGTETPNLARLEDCLYENYSAKSWGLQQFEPIADEEERAVASDLVLSAAEGVGLNVRELALAVREVHRLVGPNGRTMPGPDSTLDALIDSKQLQRAITDSVRAFGSTLDCLAAVTIGVLGLPTSLQRASGADLMRMPPLLTSAAAGQEEARAEVQRCFNSHADGSPAGWLAWAMELRDAVVHRGHLTQTWLPVPAKGTRRFPIRTETPLRFLIRLEPHLRAEPWQPDMLTLTEPGSSATLPLIWLPEPATSTLDELRTRTVELIEAICGVLEPALVTDRSSWLMPEAKWRLARTTTRRRTIAAQAFRGFNPDYPVPPLSEMRVHSRSAARFQLAEQLRTRGLP